MCRVVPGAGWVEPWKSACEETSIVMVDQFYKDVTSLSYATDKILMQTYFTAENTLFGYNDDTDATQTAKIINEYSGFNATLKLNPTLDEIKEELQDSHPVIALVSDYPLYHQTYDYGYHVVVLKGFDDAAKEFIVHDDGNSRWGMNHRYLYATIMSTLHDFNLDTKKVDGVPTVLFNRKKDA